jgi:hypothetical protein
MAAVNFPQFHIGVPSKTKFNKMTSVKKAKKVRQVLVKRKKKSKLMNGMEEYLNELVPKFVPYEGPRWFIPWARKVRPSVRYKFESLCTYGRAEVFNKIRENRIQSIFNISGYPNTFMNLAGIWKPPSLIRTMVQNIRDRHREDWKQVLLLYKSVFRFADMFNKLRHYTKVTKCMKNTVNQEDPVTLEIPKKPVYVLNFQGRCSYVYEANSLRRVMENRLLSSYWMFVEPKPPNNLLSNEEFTMGQYVSIMRQLKDYREFSVAISRFRDAEFDLTKFERNNNQYLKVSAIERHFKDEPATSRTTVIEFIKAMTIGRSVEPKKLEAFIRAYDVNKEYSYLKQWIRITKRYYISKELNDLDDLDDLYEETKLLSVKINSMF